MCVYLRKSGYTYTFHYRTYSTSSVAYNWENIEVIFILKFRNMLLHLIFLIFKAYCEGDQALFEKKKIVC